MATQYVMGQDGARLPDGVVLSHQVHGEPANQTAPAYSIGLNGDAVRPVGVTGIGFDEVPEPPRPVVDTDGVIRVVGTPVEPEPEPEPEPAPIPPPEPFVSPPETVATAEPVTEPSAPVADRFGSTDRSKHCIAKGDTCMGWRIGGSEYCAAHAGIFRKPKGDS